MGDRQDIDALLIGAVYGELDAADEARLEAHLASHPGDRAAMDALADTRSRVRADLARLPEAEPAPAISTLLLQEAARRAPKPAKGGVLAWIAGLFQPIARHPAMAGALALALVGGAAAVLHETGKVSSEETAKRAEPPVETPAAAPKAEVATRDQKPEAAETAATESYQVRLAEQAKEDEARGAIDRDGAAGKDNGLVALDADKNVAATGAASHAGTKAPAPGGAKKGGYVTVTTPDRKLKQLDDQVAQGFYAGAPSGGGGGGVGAGASANAAAGPAGTTATIGGDTGGQQVAQPPPAPRTTATAPASPGADGSYDQAQDAKLTEWAQVQHQRVVQLVKAGDCTSAGKLASEIAARAPEYYAAHVENDRAVKGCKQYIDQEKRKKANEQYKSRARGSYEPDLEQQPAAN